MKVSYLSAGDILKGRVEPILWMKTCEYFSKMGIPVRLFSTYYYRKENIPRRQVFKHFNIKTPFRITIIPTMISRKMSSLSWVRLNTAFFYFLIILPLYLFGRENVFYSKNRLCLEIVILFERVFNKKVVKVFETHKVESKPGENKFYQAMDLIVVNSRATREKLCNLGIAEKKLVLAYLAPHSEGEIIAQDKARKVLGINEQKTILMYSGKLYEQNLDFLLKCAELIQTDSIEIHVCGGNPLILKSAEESVRKYSLKNIVFHGFVAPGQVGLYLSAADFLFCSYADDLPNIAQATPAKYFDYLYVGKPFFCSANTAIDEILENITNCFFFKADNANDFVEKFNLYRTQNVVLQQMIINNQRLIKNFSWEKRTALITEKIHEILQENARAALN